MNQNYRDKCTLDLKAKLLLDKGEPYVTGALMTFDEGKWRMDGGIPWRHEMGSGGYWNELLGTGISITDLNALAAAPIQFGKESINEDTPYGPSPEY